MAVIKVEEKAAHTEMFDMGEMQEDYDCCPPVCGSKEDKKHYPTIYLYEIPDEIYNMLAAGNEYEFIIRGKVSELAERVRDSEDEGKSTKRTVDLKILEISKPQ